MHHIKIQREVENRNLGGNIRKPSKLYIFQSQWVITNLGRKLYRIIEAPYGVCLGCLKKIAEKSSSSPRVTDTVKGLLQN